MSLSTPYICNMNNAIPLTFIPIIYAIIYTITLILTISLAVLYKNVRTTTPIVCNAGASQPSYAIFVSGTGISSIILALMVTIIWARISYLPSNNIQWELYDFDNNNTISIILNYWISYIPSLSTKIINYIGFILGILHTICLAIMGAINYTKWPYLHNLSASLYIIFGLLYQICLQIIRSTLSPHPYHYYISQYQQSSSSYDDILSQYNIDYTYHYIYILRWILLSLQILCVLLMIIPGYIEIRRKKTLKLQQYHIQYSKPEGYTTRPMFKPYSKRVLNTLTTSNHNNNIKVIDRDNNNNTKVIDRDNNNNNNTAIPLTDLTRTEHTNFVNNRNAKSNITPSMDPLAAHTSLAAAAHTHTLPPSSSIHHKDVNTSNHHNTSSTTSTTTSTTSSSSSSSLPPSQNTLNMNELVLPVLYSCGNTTLDTLDNTDTHSTLYNQGGSATIEPHDYDDDHSSVLPHVIPQNGTAWKCCNTNPNSRTHMRFWSLFQYVALSLSIAFFATFISEFKDICIVL